MFVYFISIFTLKLFHLNEYHLKCMLNSFLVHNKIFHIWKRPICFPRVCVSVSPVCEWLPNVCVWCPQKLQSVSDSLTCCVSPCMRGTEPGASANGIYTLISWSSLPHYGESILIWFACFVLSSKHVCLCPIEYPVPVDQKESSSCPGTHPTHK